MSAFNDVTVISRDSESLIRVQAIRALETALASDALRGEWLQPANAWLQYLQRQALEIDEHEAPSPAPAKPSASDHPSFSPTLGT